MDKIFKPIGKRETDSSRSSSKAGNVNGNLGSIAHGFMLVHAVVLVDKALDADPEFMLGRKSPMWIFSVFKLSVVVLIPGAVIEYRRCER